MKHQQTLQKLITLLLFSTLCLASNAQLKPVAKASVYQLETKQSKILWKGPKSVGNKHNGFILFVSGVLNEDAHAKFTNGDFTINLHTISSTDNEKAAKNKDVDNLIKSSDFFDVAHHPTGRMVVKKITPTKASYFKIGGDLTLKGITKPIEFIATIKKVSNKVFIQGNLTIDRHTWGIDSKKKTETSIFPDFRDKLIADEIPVALNLVLNKQ